VPARIFRHIVSEEDTRFSGCHVSKVALGPKRARSFGGYIVAVGSCCTPHVRPDKSLSLEPSFDELEK